MKFELGRDGVTGRRKIGFASFKGTKRDAELELARLVTIAEKGERVDSSRVTVAEFMARWERDWAAANVSPKTLERYSEILRKHVCPHIGATHVQKLRPVNLSELYAKLLRSGRGPETGLAPRTVGHVHRVLHRALGHAAQWGLLHSNVAALVSPPRVTSAELEILTAAQIKIVLDALRGTSLFIIVSTALATGRRRGELLALRWKDLDLTRNDRARLQVEQSLEQTKKGLRFKAPKTKYGRRSIALPDYLVAELRAHWKSQQEARLAIGLGKAPDDSLVFATEAGETRSPNGLTKEWSDAARELKLKVTFHGLRHTHASQLIAANMDVLTISRRLGHSSPTITLAVYGHLFTNTDDRAAQIMEAAFSSRTD